MKRYLIIIVTLATFLLFQGVATAQVYTEDEDLPIPEGYEMVDSLVYVPSALVDSSLCGKSIFSVLPLKTNGAKADVHVHQSQAIRSAMDVHRVSNSDKTISGYRVRIFFDNRQTARANSEATMKEFRESWPAVPVYRSYANPYFKVTVGDFRTRSEAMQLLQLVREDFPSAFIVKEHINYPAVDREHPVTVDTLHFLRAVNDGEVVAGSPITL